MEDEQSLSVREESIRLTKRVSGRRVTASLSVSEAGVWSEQWDKASRAHRSFPGMCLKMRSNSERSSNHHVCHLLRLQGCWK